MTVRQRLHPRWLDISALRMPPQVIDVQNSDDPRDVVHRAVQALVEGRVVAFPTETVYVAAASALNPAAVGRLLELRGGSADIPLSIALRSTDDALDYVPTIPSLGMRLARRCWPGPMTLELADAHPDSVVQRLPPSVKKVISPLGNVRLRVPAHALLSEVLKLLAGPLVITAARPAGASDPITVEDVVQKAANHVDLVLNHGRCRFGQRASVVRVLNSSLEILRPGVISEANLRRLSSWMAVMVCTGNTCRSPMAEALLKKRLADHLQVPIDALEDHGYMVMSAGVAAAPGGRSANEAVMVMRERGLDVSQHESQPLTDRLVRFADVIITMTRGHREAIVQNWPEAASRVHVLSRGRSDVADPIGGPLDLYRRCADQIDELLEPWLMDFDLPEPPAGENPPADPSNN